MLGSKQTIGVLLPEEMGNVMGVIALYEHSVEDATADQENRNGIGKKEA